MATTTGPSIPQIEDHHHHHHNHHRSRVANLKKLIDVELNLLKESFEEAKRRIDPVIAQITQTRNKFDELLQQGGERREMEIERELRDLKQTTSKLKSKIPFNLITPEYQPSADPNVILLPRSDPHDPLVNDEQQIDNSPLMSLLDDNARLVAQFMTFLMDHGSVGFSVLMCFITFPERAFIKTTLLHHFVCAKYEKGAPISFLKDVLPIASDLVSKGFINSVYKKHCSSTVYGFWMDPRLIPSLKDCVSRINVRGKPISLVISTNGEDMIYNGSADMSTISNLDFLHLGRWQRFPTHHIEMPDPNLYFKYVLHMPQFKYISFRGVSVMKELPDLIPHLWYLRILDLKACHHLEVIPSNIGNLSVNLTHLDMSECYFLDHMPKGLSWLTGLVVLKGFFVGETNNDEDSCTLQDLSSMQYLVKLNIYTSMKTFPSENHLTILQGFKHLRNLTICWGGCPSRDENHELRPRKSPAIRLKRLITHDQNPVVRFDKQFPFHLEKLDLRGAPENGTSNWLTPWNFERLEKLYIRGGKLNDLTNIKEGQKGKGLAGLKPDGWSVKILRLRHLSNLHMGWSELRNGFPNVVSVEKVDCPNLTSFPCDDSGLWTANTTPPRADGSERPVECKGAAVEILEQIAELSRISLSQTGSV